MCPTLCDPIDSSPPDSSVPGILQARILEWIAISFSNACMHPKSLQSCPTLCDPIDGSQLGSSTPGILQARILEWIAISFSNECMHSKSLQSCLTLCDPVDCSPTGSSAHRILLGVGCHALLQGFFPIQGSNLCLLHLLHWHLSRVSCIYH